MERAAILEMVNIDKEYYGNRVLKDVSLRVMEGEIHALLGENGAGKSTLMNILFGMPVIHSTGGYKGEVKYQGKSITIKSPLEAMSLGIGMVHQEFMLIPGFTVRENIKLNREITKGNIISKVLGPAFKTLNHKEMDKDAQEDLDTIGLNLNPGLKVEGLPVGYMQFIEIAREIDKKNIKLLVFDEPTAVLTEEEAKRLLDTMKLLSQKGIAIIFITHRLNEVMEVAENITIMRDGEAIADKKVLETDIMQLAELMVGRKIERLVDLDKKKFMDQKVFLSLRDLKVDMPGEKVKGIDLDIYKGEIFGIGGLAGQGKIGIANGIMGIYYSSGEVFLEKKKLPLNNPLEVLKEGVAFVSEDRRGVGLLLEDTIENNIALSAIYVKNDFLKKYFIITQRDGKRIRSSAKAYIKDLDIRCTGAQQIVRRLSGGNQQKICIARALALDPKLLLVSEPTRGIDVGAKKLVLELLVKLNKERDLTIIITSSELAELRAICHRVMIVSEGKKAGILSPEASDVDYGLLLAGHSEIKNGMVEEESWERG